MKAWTLLTKEKIEPEITAYRTGPDFGATIIPAPRDRSWMSATHEKFANRCLPLLLANQAGWLILSGQKIDIWWTGFTRKSDLRVRLIEGEGPCQAESHFGYGILTWKIPFLFQVSPGYNLLARGPANLPKDGISPLEGCIEADWASATFTMNWKVTRRFKRISFDVGEPICFVVPQRRGELERFVPRIDDLASNPELEERHRAWASSREQFNQNLETKTESGWQKHYFQGRHGSTSEATFASHQTKVSLRPFTTDSNGRR